MPEPIQPSSLDLDLKEQVLHITWTDGAVSRLPLPFLRKNCPCAACRSEQEQQGKALLPVLKAPPAERIEAVGGHLVGNYALQIDWSDGHNTGIYDFRYLRQLRSSDVKHVAAWACLLGTNTGAGIRKSTILSLPWHYRRAAPAIVDTDDLIPRF